MWADPNKKRRTDDPSGNGGSISDHLLAHNVFSTWMNVYEQAEEENGLRTEKRQKRCEGNYVANAVLQNVSKLRQDLLSRLKSAGVMVPMTGDTDVEDTDDEEAFEVEDTTERVDPWYNRHAKKRKLILAVLAGGLYPCLAHVVYTERTTTLEQKKREKDAIDQGGNRGASEGLRKRKRESDTGWFSDEGAHDRRDDGKIHVHQDHEQERHVRKDEGNDSKAMFPGDGEPSKPYGSMSLPLSNQYVVRGNYNCFTPHSNVPLRSGEASVVRIWRPIERWVAYFNCTRDSDGVGTFPPIP
ncbi:hypothetical protein HK102_003928 [Quaeritorhiza haematococci]|nr:hypothetical protein HK102_003928 [Quaeritorhiza haematococci]